MLEEVRFSLRPGDQIGQLHKQSAVKKYSGVPLRPIPIQTTGYRRMRYPAVTHRIPATDFAPNGSRLRRTIAPHHAANNAGYERFKVCVV